MLLLAARCISKHKLMLLLAARWILTWSTRPRRRWQPSLEPPSSPARRALPWSGDAAQEHKYILIDPVPLSVTLHNLYCFCLGESTWISPSWAACRCKNKTKILTWPVLVLYMSPCSDSMSYNRCSRMATWPTGWSPWPDWTRWGPRCSLNPLHVLGVQEWRPGQLDDTGQDGSLGVH